MSKKKILLVALAAVAAITVIPTVIQAFGAKGPKTAAAPYTEEQIAVIRQIAAEEVEATMKGEQSSASNVLTIEQMMLILNSESSSSERIQPLSETESKDNEGDSEEAAEENELDLDEVTVKYIIDGDTIIVFRNDGSGDEFKVRLLGVDTPESVASEEYQEKSGKENTSFGITASEYTKSHLKQGQVVYLTSDASDMDSYGRKLRYLWTEKPQSLSEEEFRAKCYNAKLVSNGYALCMSIEPNTSWKESFSKLQQTAMSDRRGLWADPTWWEYQGL